MNRFYLLLLVICWGMMEGRAQTPSDEVRQDDKEVVRPALLCDSLPVSLALPAPHSLFYMSAPGFDGCGLGHLLGYGPVWDLHQGFNAQFGMSVTAGLGKHAPRGVGFGQSIALAYAQPLGNRFSLAGGLYVQNMDWGSFHQKDVGLAAVLGYKVNESISLYAYGAKSILPESGFRPLGYFPFAGDQVRDRIGAMADFKISDQVKIQVSIERHTVVPMRFPQENMIPPSRQ